MSDKQEDSSHAASGGAFVRQVQAQIETHIGTGELQAGSRVNESSLAQKLGVSRGPIREACRSLEQQGILRSEHNRGFFVRSIGVKEALDIYDLRASLFAMAGRLAATVVSVSQIDELRELVDQMNQAAAENDIGSFYHLNNEFHRHLIEIADNIALSEVWPQLEARLYLYRRSGFFQPESMQASNEDHRAIVQALEAGDPVRAASVMERHILRGRARMLRSLGVEALSVGGDESSAHS